MKLVTVEEMRAIEQQADAHGWTYAQMMEAAGVGLARVVAEAYTQLAEHTVLGLVGGGNNGGDTLVALAELQRLGWQVAAYLARPRPNDPLVARVAHGGGWILEAADDPRQETLRRAIADHAVLLDGLLGTGARPPLRAETARILAAAKEAATAHGVIVVAVDVPSGIDSNTGEAAEATLPADLTVTMAAAKVGMAQMPALGLVGNVVAVDIGLPEGLPAWEAIHRYWAEAEMVRALLPPRPAEAHKGLFGHALIAAGSVNFAGAPLLAGKAAYRAGAGRVTLAVPTPLHNALAGALPEAAWLLLPHEMGVLAEDAADVLQKALPRATALLLGPGLGQEQATADFLARLLGAKRQGRGTLGFVPAENNAKASENHLPPLVVEADALKLLARLPDWPQRLPGPAVLLPHPGEMATLTNSTPEAIQADRLAAAEKYAKAWGHIVVLKGAGTVVASPDGQTAVIPVATPALARAGSGDVLAGMVVGLLAQGLSPWEAAVAGAWLHAQAGLFAWENTGTTASVLAREVADALPRVFNAIGYG